MRFLESLNLTSYSLLIGVHKQATANTKTLSKTPARQECFEPSITTIDATVMHEVDGLMREVDATAIVDVGNVDATGHESINATAAESSPRRMGLAFGDDIWVRLCMCVFMYLCVKVWNLCGLLNLYIA